MATMQTKAALRGVALATMLLASTTAAVVAADRGDVQRACFVPADLAALPTENRPVKGVVGSHVAVPAINLPQASALPAALRGAIRRVELPKGRKLVALTLDLCEQPGEVAGYDGAIIDYLRATGTKATLFAGGKWLATHVGRSQQLMTDPLFEVGVHGWAHRNVRGLAGTALTAEIVDPLKAYRKVRGDLAGASCVAGRGAAMTSVPATPTLHRFPYGACSAAALETAAQNGLMSIQWDVSTGDPWPGQSARAIADGMLRNTRPGSIVIAHANGRGHHTADALPLAIPKLKAMGYEFVTVSELMAAGRPVITDTCFDSRPGDTDRYDYLFARRSAPAKTGAPTDGKRLPAASPVLR